MIHLALAVLVAAAAVPANEAGLDDALADYKKGAYAQAIKRLKKLVDAGTLSSSELARAKVMLGAAQWGGGEVPAAKATVASLLDSQPDVELSLAGFQTSFARYVEKQRRARAEAKAQASPPPAVVAAQVAPPVVTPAPAPVAAPLPAPAKQKLQITRVAILDPQVVGEAGKKELSAYMQAIVAEVTKLQAVRVMSASDLRDLLGLEREKQLLGCGSEESCLAEMAGALDVDEMLSVSVTMTGATATVACSRLSVKSSLVLQRDTRTIEKSGGAELLALVGKQVEALYPGVPLREGKTRGIDTETLRRLIPPPLPKWVFFSTVGGAVVAGAAGAFMGLQMQNAQTQFATLAAQAVTTPVAASDLKALETRAKNNALVANGLFIGAASLGAASVVVALLTDWAGPAPAVALVPSSEGAMVSFGGRF